MANTLTSFPPYRWPPLTRLLAQPSGKDCSWRWSRRSPDLAHRVHGAREL